MFKQTSKTVSVYLINAFIKSCKWQASYNKIGFTVSGTSAKIAIIAHNQGNVSCCMVYSQICITEVSQIYSFISLYLY